MLGVDLEREEVPLAFSFLSPCGLPPMSFTADSGDTHSLQSRAEGEKRNWQQSGSRLGNPPSVS